MVVSDAGKSQRVASREDAVAASRTIVSERVQLGAAYDRHTRRKALAARPPVVCGDGYGWDPNHTTADRGE
jgi:hypothetical protein